MFLIKFFAKIDSKNIFITSSIVYGFTILLYNKFLNFIVKQNAKKYFIFSVFFVKAENIFQQQFYSFIS